MKKWIVCLLTALSAFAGWDDVRRLPTERKIEISMRKGEPARGTFVAAGDAELVVRESAGERTIARGEIRRVRVLDSSRRTRNAAIGAAVGAGVGLAAGFLVCPHCANEGNGGKYVGPLGAAGAGAGAAVGLLASPYRTIYKAK